MFDESLIYPVVGFCLSIKYQIAHGENRLVTVSTL